MKLKKMNPITPSQRNLIKIVNKNLRNKPFIKSKIKGFKNSSGRNSKGIITSKHKGGGHKQKYRKIDFNRIYNSIGITTSIEYDPNRTSYIASVYQFSDKKYFYMLAPKNLKIGDIIKSGISAEIKLGHSLPLAKIPVGSIIHNLSPKLSKPSQISRSAGTYSLLLEKYPTKAKIRISSGEQRFVSINCYATIGQVSNELNSLTTKGKAGRSRWLNKRPKVRGVAMNPIDHPHGGGEGKKSGANKTPWGKPNKRGSTSTSKNKLIIKKYK
mmetsp:Transcript_196/g.470  ORF Transcript_196/g.470 Transcript_196/m.470 type:complete len:270 (+) Transcript_196:20-829(+)